MSWILAFAGFSFLIIAHEAGHMVAAKAVGMRVERFFLFFPPKLWSVKRGETEYGIGSIPLGGFVKITGMNPDEELEPEVARREGVAAPETELERRPRQNGRRPGRQKRLNFGVGGAKEPGELEAQGVLEAHAGRGDRQRGVETQIPDRVLCAGQDEGVAARETHVARADALGRRRVQAQVGV